MKRILNVCLFIFILVGSVIAQNDAVTCNLGFAFEISENRNWGYKEPVVVDITPGSPAERAGLKLNDIILSVNKNGTYQKTYQTVMSWFNQYDTEMTLAIRNFEHAFKEMSFSKDCRSSNAINEAQLAPVFAFYSLEDVQDRRFLMPVATKTNEKALFHNYQSFGFAPSDEATRDLDERINAIFIRALTSMGLEYRPDDPDFVIQTYYDYQNNPLFKTDSPTYGSYQPVWRYDTRNNRTVRVPLYNPSEAVRVEDIAYNLEFGYRFYDRKFMEAGEPALMWESEAKERVSGYYTLLDYLELNLPLMLMKFPNPGNLSFATYQVKYLKYNYTGIGYDMNDLKTVVSVDPGSPAALAGIRSGDVVVNIQGQDFNHTSRSLTEGYRRFLAETMNLRDRSTRYTDSNGFKECMFWDVSNYRAVADAISNNRRYHAAFSYLFNFNQYIDWNTPAAINIEVERDGAPMSFAVIPRITTSSHILAY
ncbi:MAG: PDZ domain-containing protein [Bacteroidales bacterium]|nr:PDZ domain-containing protein [Bacteroidales bacterium]